jgi:excisionase family DNA binding protein
VTASLARAASKIAKEFDMAMITVAEAAKRLNVSELTVRRWISHGHLTAYRLGSKLIRLDPDEVDQFGTPTLGSLNYD